MTALLNYALLCQGQINQKLSNAHFFGGWEDGPKYQLLAFKIYTTFILVKLQV